MLQGLDRIGPVVAVIVAAGLILMVDLVTPRSRKRWLAWLAVAGLGAAAIWLVTLIVRDRQASFYSDTMSLDNYSIFFTFLFIGVSGAVVLASLDYAERLGSRQGEFFALVLLATAGMMLLAGARDLVTIFVSLELASVSQYILAGFLRDDKGSEAALKYLLLGAMSSAVILYGMAYLFGIAGTTRLVSSDGSRSIASVIAAGDGGTRTALIVSMVFIAAGFGFKMAIVPFQMWTPDVYQGAPVPVAAFLSVGSKAAAFAVVMRIFFQGFGAHTFIASDWKELFSVVAAVTMTVGNVMALRQSNIRRLLGYSSIAQAGNFLVGVAAVSAAATAGASQFGASGVVFFIATYAFTNLGAFFAIMAISNRTGSDEIADYAGMGRRAPIPAAVLLFCLLSLTGLPPTAGFIAKVYIFNAAVQAHLVWLVVIAVLNTAVSAFYYLGVARRMYLDTAEGEPVVPTPAFMQAILVTAGLGVLTFGIYPIPLIDAAQRAVNVFA